MFGAPYGSPPEPPTAKAELSGDGRYATEYDKDGNIVKVWTRYGAADLRLRDQAARTNQERRKRRG